MCSCLQKSVGQSDQNLPGSAFQHWPTLQHTMGGLSVTVCLCVIASILYFEFWSNSSFLSHPVTLIDRRLWQHVTASLKTGDIDTATEHKHQLEERQRREGKQRTTSNVPWNPKYFIKEVEQLQCGLEVSSPYIYILLVIQNISYQFMSNICFVCNDFQGEGWVYHNPLWKTK